MWVPTSRRLASARPQRLQVGVRSPVLEGMFSVKCIAEADDHCPRRISEVNCEAPQIPLLDG